MGFLYSIRKTLILQNLIVLAIVLVKNGLKIDGFLKTVYIKRAGYTLLMNNIMKENEYMSIEQSKERKDTEETDEKNKHTERIEQNEQKEKFESPFFEIVNEKGEIKKFCKGVFYEKEPNKIGKICENLVFYEPDFLKNIKSIFEKVLSEKIDKNERLKIVENFENKIIEFRIDLKDRIQRAIIDGITDETTLKNTNTLGLIISAASLDIKNALMGIVENKDHKGENKQEEEIGIALLRIEAKTVKSIEGWLFNNQTKEENFALFHSQKEYDEYLRDPAYQEIKTISCQENMYSAESFHKNSQFLETSEEIDKNIESAKEKSLDPFFEIKDKKTGQAAKICRGLFLDKEFDFINDLEYIFGEREEWKKWTGEKGRDGAQKYMEDFSANMEKLSFSLKERTDRAVANGITDKVALENAYQLSILAMMAASELRDVFVENVFGENDSHDSEGKQENTESLKDIPNVEDIQQFVRRRIKKERIEKKIESLILRIKRKFVRSMERIIIKSEKPEFSGTEDLEFPGSEEYKWLKMFIGKESEGKEAEDDFETNRGKEYHIDKNVFFVEEGKLEYDEFLKGPSARIVYRKPKNKKEKKEENLEQISDAEFEDFPKESEPEKNKEEKPLGSENPVKVKAVLEDKMLEGRDFYLIGHLNQNLDRFKDIVDGIFKNVFTKRDTEELFCDYKKGLNSLREDLLIFNAMLPERIEKARKEYKKEENRYGKKTLNEEAMETTELLAKFFSSWIENIRIDMLRYIAKDPKMDVGDITNEYIKETDKLRQSIGKFVLNIKSAINSKDLAIIDLKNGSYHSKLDDFVFFDNIERLAMEIRDNAEDLMKKYRDLRKTEAYIKACEKVGMILKGEEDIDFREMIREEGELRERLKKFEKKEDSESFKIWEKKCEEKRKRMPKKKWCAPSADVGEFSDMGEIRPKKEGFGTGDKTAEERIDALHCLAIEIYAKRITFTAPYYINAMEALNKLVGKLEPESENRKMFKVIKKDIQDVQPPNEEIKDLHKGFIVRLKELLKEITSATEKKSRRNIAEAEQEESTEEKFMEEVVKKEWYEVGAGEYKDFADKFKNINGELQKIPSYVSETEVGKIDWKKEKTAMQKESEMETQAAEKKLKEVWPSEEKIGERYENLTKNLKETIKKISKAEEKEGVDLYLQSVNEANDIEKKLKSILNYVELIDYLDAVEYSKNIEKLNSEETQSSADIAESEIDINENSKILEEIEKKLEEEFEKKQMKEKVLDGKISESSKDMIEFKDEAEEIRKKINEARKKIEEAKRKIEENRKKIEKARIEAEKAKKNIEKAKERTSKKAKKMSEEIEKIVSKSRNEIDKIKPDRKKLKKYLENILEDIAEFKMPVKIKNNNELVAYCKLLENAYEKASKVDSYLSSFDSKHIPEGEKNQMKKMIIKQINNPVNEMMRKLEKLIE